MVCCPITNMEKYTKVASKLKATSYSDISWKFGG